jgi:SAM-dependent methyltransferase
VADEKFDGLAENYDGFRPRYPKCLVETIADKVKACNKRSQPSPLVKVVDAGAGTGIFLEIFGKIFESQFDAFAVDISEDMISAGKHRVPSACWVKASFEDYAKTVRDVNLINFAQSYHWMDRKNALRISKNALLTNGWLSIIDNNRNYGESEFLDHYESLLEEYVPGYSRKYRDYDVMSELEDVFGGVGSEFIYTFTSWELPMAAVNFIKFCSSSTQVQKALKLHKDTFLKEIDALVGKFSCGENLIILYKSELYLAKKVN